MTRISRAELYALTHRGTPGDVAFYRRACRGSRSVLELGSGFGRILAALVSPGRRLVGIERDPGLLALARRALPRSAAELICADMRSFELERKFARILIPYSGFFCLLTDADALSCLRAVRRHLAPGGRLLLDTYAADGFHAQTRATPGRRELDFVVSIAHRGRHWDVFEKSRWRKAKRRIEVSYVYRDRKNGSAIELELPQHYWGALELRTVLERAGLELRSLHGDFQGARYRPESSELMVVSAEARP
ncbi:MAG TPA: class I SAM-dependent methyltransferase [Polyangiaceae bacterium]|nr:class I SAM-dependent methyltransferase [Polyangiaceae bacterium]